MSKIRIDESALKRLRQGRGAELHNVNLVSWPQVEGLAPAGVGPGQYGSAVIDLAVFVLDAIINPTQARTRAVLGMIGAGVSETGSLMALASNMDALAERVRLMAEEGVTVGEVDGNHDGPAE